MMRDIPAGRFGRSEDVVYFQSFFADPHSDFTTGEVLYVVGGSAGERVPG